MTALPSPAEHAALRAGLPGAAPNDQADAQFAFGRSDFERVRRLIREHAGISLNEGKQAMVYSRLSRRLRDTGHGSFTAYLDALEQAGPGPEWQEFVNCLTTNLTAFFREEHHFHDLARELEGRRGGPIRIWCNAASTGEEPYSIAMTVTEALGNAGAAKIVASDIDTKVLATAAAGVYGADARGLTPERLRRHFLRGTGANSGRIRVKPELARAIDFRVHNLMAPRWSFEEGFDIVFCRNVMIYFDAPTQRQVLERIHAAMKPRSVLYVGHSENFTDSKDLFRLRGKTVYERV
ncbi:MAG: chemotaxis protein CheR [Ideonella sp.]|jgi:chemotaxis protein methyltransferase CheR|nr:chemotaxis protein CheR [Ideonella sp.]